MASAGSEPEGLLHVSSGLISYAAENIQGSRERRRVDELPRGTVLPNAPEHAAKVQRVVLAPDYGGVAMPCPLAVGLVRQPCIIAIVDFALLPRPCQMVVEQQALVRGITGTQIEQRVTEAAGHDRIDSEFAAEGRAVHR